MYSLFFSLKSGSFGTGNLVYNRAGNAHRGEYADQYTDEDCKNKSTDHFTAKDEHHQQGEECGAAGVNSTSQRGIDSIVHLDLQSAFGEILTVLTNTVENNHSGVNGVTNNRQDGCNERLVDIQVEGEDTVEQGKNTNYQKGIVNQGSDTTQTETPVLERIRI